MQIDPFEFARRQDGRQGDIVASEMARMADLGWRVVRGSFELHGGGSTNGPWWIDLQAAARVQTLCQRCLGELELDIHADSRLELAASEAEADAADDDEVDRIDGSRPLDVATLVEDELILALPMVGRHEQCEATVVPDRPEGPLGKALGAWTGRRLAN
jgi:uncharacterized protein